jgi:hypothetical protein
VSSDIREGRKIATRKIATAYRLNDLLLGAFLKHHLDGLVPTREDHMYVL